jgi:hypothetical protein
MRILFCLMLLTFVSFCNQSRHAGISDKNAGYKKISYECIYDSTFEYHFRILDSISNASPNDSVYECCTPTIKFMEDKTKIEASTDGTFLGRLAFSKRDLQKWHEWHDSKTNKGNQQCIRRSIILLG